MSYLTFVKSYLNKIIPATPHYPFSVHKAKLVYTPLFSNN